MPETDRITELNNSFDILAAELGGSYKLLYRQEYDDNTADSVFKCVVNIIDVLREINAKLPYKVFTTIER